VPARFFQGLGQPRIELAEADLSHQHEGVSQLKRAVILSWWVDKRQEFKALPLPMGRNVHYPRLLAGGEIQQSGQVLS